MIPIAAAFAAARFSPCIDPEASITSPRSRGIRGRPATGVTAGAATPITRWRLDLPRTLMVRRSSLTVNRGVAASMGAIMTSVLS